MINIEIKDGSHVLNGYEFNLSELKIDALIGNSESSRVDFLLELSEKLGLNIESITHKPKETNGKSSETT